MNNSEKSYSKIVEKWNNEERYLCAKCGNGKVFHELFYGGVYCYCNKCCSFNEDSKYYIYSHLGNTVERAAKIALQSSIIIKNPKII